MITATNGMTVTPEQISKIRLVAGAPAAIVYLRGAYNPVFITVTELEEGGYFD